MTLLGKTKQYLLHLEADEGTHKSAKRLRRKMTDAEKILWRSIRNRKLDGLKFRRQHPIKNYIADFYCFEINLVIEIDGKVHDKKDQIEHDDNRTAELERFGVNVIRFTNDEVENNLGKVLKEIIEFVI